MKALAWVVLVARVASFVPASAMGAADQTIAQQLEDLRVPGSPAFVLLGVEPSSVERPATPKALGLALFSAARDSNLIPSNYALEVGPYWLVHHPRLNFKQLYDGIGPTLLQTLSLSMGTAQRGAQGDSVPAGSSVAFAVRASVLAGHRPPRATAMAESLSHVARAFLREIPDDSEGLPEEIIGSLPDSTPEQHRLKARLQRLEDERRRIALDLADALRHRPGFHLEVAGGFVEDFPGKVFDHGRLGLVGGWVTPSLEEGNVSILTVLRYSRNGRGAVGKGLTDLGGRLVWELGDLKLSGEYVHRSVSDVPAELGSTSRVAGMVEYRLSDGLIVTGTFGGDFAKAGEGRTLVSALGMSWAFGQAQKIAY